jgi:CheY-like chemotaxis protein/HPt (histidine-containing phosphotransfer) domain-containing protein
LFEICDTGIGIPKSALEKMFQAFSQADSSMNRRFGGTGLGLSISKRLVERMGGEIGVESSENQGSTFWFRIEFERADLAHLPRNPGIFHVPLKKAERSARILVAEDNLINQKVVMKTLEYLGHRADVVANGNEALDALRSIPYDLILMDCQMPEMDGYEATRIIRQSRTLACSDIVIIAMTANAIDGDRERCLSIGMNDYMSKPFRPEELAQLIEKWLPQIKKSAPCGSTNTLPIGFKEDVIDRGALERVCQFDDGAHGDTLCELIGLFLELTPKRIEHLKQALEQKNWHTLSREAHSLKSSSANLGVKKVLAACRRLEAIENHPDLSVARQLVTEIETEYATAAQSLQELLKLRAPARKASA